MWAVKEGNQPTYQKIFLSLPLNLITYRYVSTSGTSSVSGSFNLSCNVKLQVLWSYRLENTTKTTEYKSMGTVNKVEGDFLQILCPTRKHIKPVMSLHNWHCRGCFKCTWMRTPRECTESLYFMSCYRGWSHQRILDWATNEVIVWEIKL